ncbi:hypothetical protein [Kitasatospora purpeofusca]|nr:hypothetical protein OIP63_00390 [Kitasatospora purpeofusca]
MSLCPGLRIHLLREAGRTDRARQALLEAIARHHHGPLPDEEPDDRPW